MLSRGTSFESQGWQSLKQWEILPIFKEKRNDFCDSIKEEMEGKKQLKVLASLENLDLIELQSMDCCPNSLHPPTQELSNARKILQLLAAGLFVLSLFSMLSGDFFSILMHCLLAYLLMIGWSQFSYLSVLNFFLIAFLQATISYVVLIGVIEYGFPQEKGAVMALFAIAKITYYPTAVIFSHEAYKKIKQFNSCEEGNGNIFGDYQLMERSNQAPRVRQDDRSIGGFRPFQGNAVPII